MKSKIEAMGFVACICLVVLLGVYFRTYALHYNTGASLQKRMSLAQRMVVARIESQMDVKLAVQEPSMSAAARKKLAHEEAQRAIAADRPQFESAIERLSENIASTAKPPNARRYLLGADSYHYYGLTDNIARIGNISKKFKNGKYFNPLRMAPEGLWSPVNIHPYLGYCWYRILDRIKPGIPMMEALSFYPLILTALVVAAFFVLCRSLELGLLSSTMGSLALALSPVVIQRSSFGWYDTDPYNLIFPLMVFSSMFFGARKPRHAALAGIVGGLLTGLYALFWVGWPFLLISTGGCGVLMLILGRFTGDPTIRGALRYTVSFAGFGIASAVLLISPAAFVEGIVEGGKSLALFAPGDVNLWPNIFITVGEARSVGVQKLIYLTGNYMSAVMALAGIFLWGFTVLRSEKREGVSMWSCFMFLAAVLGVMALRTERFSLLLMIPFSVFVAAGVNWIYRHGTSLLKIWSRGKMPVLIRSAGVGALVMVFLIPNQLIFAHALGMKSGPIMNDVWYDSLRELEAISDDKSIVYSWWSPGHFITSVARRGVVADGGSQHFPETYWISRLFMAQDAQEAVGILRMLNSGGNDAVSYLEEKGVPLPDAIAMAGDLLGMSRDEQFEKIRMIMPEQDARNFMDKMWGETAELPTYVYLYNEMIENNIAMTIMAEWDFRKVLAEKSGAPRMKGVDEDTGGSYVRESLRMSKVLKYTSESAMTHREGNRVFFANGLSLDLETFDAYMHVPDSWIEGRPVSLFHLSGGIFQEKVYEGKRVDMSALLIDREGSYSVVMADRKLIKSLLFRLYFLRGEGLDVFKLVFDKGEAVKDTWIQIYEVDWERLKKAKEESL